jgi:hypothetical protein
MNNSDFRINIKTYLFWSGVIVLRAVLDRGGLSAPFMLTLFPPFEAL